MLLLFTGCNKMYTRWNYAQSENTIESYKEFLKQYPQDTTLSEEARKRISDANYAFYATCQIGTSNAFQGFVNSYSISYYVPLAKYRIEFLDAVKPEDINSYNTFIVSHPDNPFVLEAKTSIPVLWLSELKEKFGVSIYINELVGWKGMFRGKTTKEKVRHDLFKKLKEDLEKENIQCVLMDSTPLGGDSVYIESTSTKSILTVIEITYNETKGDYKSPTYTDYQPLRPGETYLGQTLENAAAANIASCLTGLIFGPDIKISTEYTIKDEMKDKYYYSNITSLFKPVARLEMINVLDWFNDDKKVVPILVIAANASDTTAQQAITMLAQIGNEDCFEHLTRMLKNAKHDVRAIVASTLGEKKDTRAVEPLISALQDEDPLVIENAADALKNITNQDLGEDHNQWLEWWQSPHEDYNQWLEWWQRQSSQNEK